MSKTISVVSTGANDITWNSLCSQLHWAAAPTRGALSLRYFNTLLIFQLLPDDILPKCVSYIEAICNVLAYKRAVVGTNCQTLLFAKFIANVARSPC